MVVIVLRKEKARIFKYNNLNSELYAYDLNIITKLCEKQAIDGNTGGVKKVRFTLVYLKK